MAGEQPPLKRQRSVEFALPPGPSSETTESPIRPSGILSARLKVVEMSPDLFEDEFEADHVAFRETSAQPGEYVEDIQDVDEPPESSNTFALPADIESTLSSDLQCFWGSLLNEPCSVISRPMIEAERGAAAFVLGDDLKIPERALICSHHRTEKLLQHTTKLKSCCDPFSTHSRKRKSQLDGVSPLLAWYFQRKGCNVKPYDAICRHCEAQAKKEFKLRDDSSPVTSASNTPGCSQTLSGKIRPEQAKEDLEKIFQDAGIEPISLEHYTIVEKEKVARKKLIEVKNKVQTLLHVSLGLQAPATVDESKSEECNKKASDHEELMESLKKKLAESNFKDKIRILTLAPQYMTNTQVAVFFDVTLYMVKLARKMRKEKGILSEIDARKSKGLPEETMKILNQFYNDDEYARVCPGLKDSKSIGGGLQMQKRLLLGSLRELYTAFKMEHPEAKIGFSLFCAARPKWCMLAKSSGTHIVCVCKYHQNPKLLLDAADMKTDSYKQLILNALCEIPTRECHMRLCPKCCKPNDVLNMVKSELRKSLELADDLETDSSEEDQVTIEFRQWVSTDRPDLVVQELPFLDFAQLFTDQLLKLIPHDYTSKQQSNYVKNLKNQLHEDKVLVQLDFSENYTFLVQEEIQSHHFSKQQCTMHPTLIYYNDGEEVKYYSLNFISDDLRHDVAHVQCIISEIIKFIKEKLPHVKKVEYVSDGCAAQYKCCKAFLNLCKHEERHGLKAVWTFFATSHGKSACDGLAGADKRVIREESLRRVKGKKKPINSVDEVMAFCIEREKNGLSNIQHKLIRKQEVFKEREMQEKLQPKTVQGTHGFHYIEPLSASKIGCKTLSSDTRFSLKVDLNENMRQIDIEEGCYVCLVLNEDWQVGYIKAINHEENEADIILLTPKDARKSKFDWVEDKVITVPLKLILCPVNMEVTEELGRKTTTRTLNRKLKKYQESFIS